MIRSIYEKRFQNKITDFFKMLNQYKNADDIKKELGINRQEISRIMKAFNERINIIKFDKNDWVNDVEIDTVLLKLSIKPQVREILDKIFQYVEISKDFNFLMKIKKILDNISEKISVTMFESMTDEEYEEYFEENMEKEKSQKKENGYAINNFFE